MCDDCRALQTRLEQLEREANAAHWLLGELDRLRTWHAVVLASPRPTLREDAAAELRPAA